MDTLKKAADDFWYSRGRWIDQGRFLDSDTSNGHELSNAAFFAGARRAMTASAQLSPHIARFIEMIVLLGFADATPAEVDNSQSHRKSRSTRSNRERSVRHVRKNRAAHYSSVVRSDVLS